MVLVDRIILVHIDLEESVVSLTLEILVWYLGVDVRILVKLQE
jgi:hypothetical protein